MTRDTSSDNELYDSIAYWAALDDWDGKAIARAEDYPEEPPC